MASQKGSLLEKSFYEGSPQEKHKIQYDIDFHRDSHKTKRKDTRYIQFREGIHKESP